MYPQSPRGLWFRREAAPVLLPLEVLGVRKLKQTILLTFTLGWGPVLSLFKNAVLTYPHGSPMRGALGMAPF